MELIQLRPAPHNAQFGPFENAPTGRSFSSMHLAALHEERTDGDDLLLDSAGAST